MDHTSIHNRKELKPLRKLLRHSLTPPEKRLWLQLQGSKLGAKFRRQHSIGSYIVDNYCPKYKLAVEIDGQTHDNGLAHKNDVNRTDYLTKQGVRVIRFTNVDIMNNLEGVLAEIKKQLR